MILQLLISAAYAVSLYRTINMMQAIASLDKKRPERFLILDIFDIGDKYK